MSTNHLPDASKLCWRMAHAVTRERDRGWSAVGPPWSYLCSDIDHDWPARPAAAARALTDLLAAYTRSGSCDTPPADHRAAETDVPWCHCVEAGYPGPHRCAEGCAPDA